MNYDCDLGYKDRLYLYNKMPILKCFLTSSVERDQQLVEALLIKISKSPNLQNKETYNKLNEALKICWDSLKEKI